MKEANKRPLGEPVSGLLSASKPLSAFGLLFAVLLAGALCLSLAACSSGDSNSQNTQNTQNEQREQDGQGSGGSSQNKGSVQMSIDTSALDSGDVKSFTVQIPDGSTALDALRLSGVQYTTENSSYGVLVTSIDSIKQGDHGSMSGWLFLVNEKFAEVSADKLEVKDGDLITWIYTVDGTFPGMEE